MRPTERIEPLRNSFVEMQRFLEYLQKDSGLTFTPVIEQRLNDLLLVAGVVDIEATQGLIDTACREQRAVQLLIETRNELRGLRRQMQLLSAKVETLELVERLLGASPGPQMIGMAEDVTFKIDRFLHEQGLDINGHPLPPAFKPQETST